MELKTLLSDLSNADGFGGLDGALTVAERYLSTFATVTRKGGNLIAELGDGEKTVMLEAHIDEIGLIVTSVENGFLSVSNVGGIDPRMLSGMKVKIHGKKPLKGVFCSVPPHLRKTNDDVPKIGEIFIDTGLSNAGEFVSAGDRVTFCQNFASLLGSLVTGKALDNRAGVAAVIKAGELLSKEVLNTKVVILLSDMEEIGGMGAKVGAFGSDIYEAVAVDVSFGNAPDCDSTKTGVLGGGAMLGISPVLSLEVTNKLKNAAEKIGADLQTEVMGGKTSTDADAIAFSKFGVKCGLLSIPLRNMHTPVEVADLKDVEDVAKILAQYVKDFRL
jgi:endoglucanase